MQVLLLCLVGVLLVCCGDGGHKNVPREPHLGHGLFQLAGL